eukprot:scaffold57_cov254-Pinguiococcus_pyrenoidosus.AAC.55
MASFPVRLLKHRSATRGSLSPATESSGYQLMLRESVFFGNHHIILKNREFGLCGGLNVLRRRGAFQKPGLGALAGPAACRHASGSWHLHDVRAEALTQHEHAVPLSLPSGPRRASMETGEEHPPEWVFKSLLAEEGEGRTKVGLTDTVRSSRC